MQNQKNGILKSLWGVFSSLLHDKSYIVILCYMTPSADLHELIHSLSKTEKRYFKLYVARTSGAKNTLALRVFDAIAKQKSYDEKALLQKFGEENLSTNFSSYKNHVYNIILRSLSYYHDSTSATDSFASQVRQIKILCEKTLYKQAYKLNQRLRKRALEYEEYATVLESVAIDRLILFARSGEYLFDAEPNIVVERLNNIANHALQQWQKIVQIKNTEAMLIEGHHNFNKRFSSGLEAKTWASGLLEHSYLHPSFQPETLNQFIAYHYVYFLFESRYCGNLGKGLEHVLMIARKYESMPERIKSDGVMYLNVCTWVITAALWMYNDGAATEYLHKLREAPEKYGIERSSALDKYELQSYMYEGGLLSIALDEHRISDFAAKAEKALEKWEYLKYYRDEKQIIITIITMLFAVGHYEECVRWCMRLLRYKKYADDVPIAVIARVCLLLAHFHLGNSELLSSLARSSLRVAEKSTLNADHCRAFFLCMQRIAHAENDKEIRRHIHTMLEEVDARRRTLPPNVQAQPDHSIFVVWGNAYLKNIPYKEEAFARFRRARVEQVPN